MPGTLACHSLGEAAENAAGPQGLNGARCSYQLLAIGQTLVSWRRRLLELERFGVGELISYLAGETLAVLKLLSSCA